MKLKEVEYKIPSREERKARRSEFQGSKNKEGMRSKFLKMLAAEHAQELKDLLKEKKLLLFTLKQKLRTMQLTNNQEIRQVKKDIARISTAINAKIQG